MAATTDSTARSGTTRPAIVGPETPQPPYPLFADTTVIAGFGRGSSDLGIPTANIPPDSYEPILAATAGKEASDTGIYYGFAAVYPSSAEEVKDCELKNASHLSDVGKAAAAAASSSIANPQSRDIDFSYGRSLERGVDSHVVLPMVMSVGWNPFYGNKSRSAEIYIIHKFGSQFYGARIKFVVLGYIRPELDYVSVEALIQDINTDVAVALKSLERPAYAVFKDSEFFQASLE